MAYLYEACDQKGQTDRGKTVNPLTPPGYNYVIYC